MKKLSVICILVLAALITFIGTSCGDSNEEQKVIDIVKNYHSSGLSKYGKTLDEQIIGYDNFIKNSMEKALASGNFNNKAGRAMAENSLKGFKNQTYEWTASSEDGNLWTVVLTNNRPEASYNGSGGQGIQYIYEVNLSKKTLCAIDDNGAPYLIGLSKRDKLENLKPVNWRKETLSSIK
ncbi:MAG: hypothetical protein LBT79_02435 [Elusimicrobiota bacterium]|jgi:hypothetical protein|nr:hypothetical protein [Elusimicrobiota bacterium]